MIFVLIDAALRSLLVGLIVAVALRAFRIRNVFAQKAALGLVLAGALAMPLLMPIMDRLQVLPANAGIVLPAYPMTLLEELQARIQAKSGSGTLPNPLATPVPAAYLPQTGKASEPAPDNAPAPRAKERSPSNLQPVPPQTQTATKRDPVAQDVQPMPRRNRLAFSPPSVAFSIYFGVATVLLLRLAVGLAVTLRLCLNAEPISTDELSDITAGLHLRASTQVSSPLTVGSVILLPANYKTWDKEKFRIVLAHERSHVRQCDFYLQLLAGLYTALVWFSPLGWWLKRELAELAEAISDRAGIEEARSRTSYSQVLLEFAAAPRSTMLGVAMARPGSLARRIERLLNDHTFRQCFASSKRSLLAFVLVPLALVAGAAMVRVQAATHSAPLPWVAPAVRSAAPAPTLEPETAYPTEQLATENAEPDYPAVAARLDASASDAVLPETENPAIATPEIAAAQTVPNLFPVPAVARTIGAQSEQGTSLSFDRTVSAGEDVQLMVSTGSGNIDLTRGSSNQVHVHGEIHVSREGSKEQARQIAANPPIEQTGNVIRVEHEREQDWHGISISYQIEAPAGSLLGAISGSGNIVDEGVGKNAKLETGSGDVSAKGLQGPLELKTGSGNITAEQTGQGDVNAETGSGNIEIKDVQGSFRARTGSGDIKATGTPSGSWTLETGSGNIELWSANAPLTLDASTGSGSVTTDHEMLVKGSLEHHHVTGNLNGGGPMVRVRTGSGEVLIH